MSFRYINDEPLTSRPVYPSVLIYCEICDKITAHVKSKVRFRRQYCVCDVCGEDTYSQPS